MASWEIPSDETLRTLLSTSHTIAIVGCSPSPDRTSHHIAQALQRRGYRIVPVHPAGGSILGETAYPSLDAIPSNVTIDIVNVFRRQEETVPIAEATVRRRARALWLQQGIVNEEAYRIATGAGLICVMDACIAVLQRMLLANKPSRT